MDEGMSPLSATRTVVKRSKSYKSRLCISSKAASIILLWHFAILLGYKMVYNVDTLMQISYNGNVQLISAIFFAVITAFSPIVGFIADIKLSRYRAAVCSSFIISIEVVVFLLLLVVALINVERSFINSHFKFFQNALVTIIFLGIMVVPFIVFLINGFQFGMDQLQNSSTENLILFIHWYVWINYACTFITELQWNLITWRAKYFWIYGFGMSFFNVIVTVVLLTVSMCVVKHRRVWFLIEPPGPNPLKLLYKIVKFAFQHKVPLRRSAFTYCEEEIPSRLDFGKHKYGGPFTTKQVEDVKAFLSILKVLFLLGPVFLLQTVITTSLPGFARHSNVFKFKLGNETLNHIHIEGVARHIFISNGLLSPALVVICLPLYLCFIRPYLLYHIPGMFKRMGLGMVLMILSFVAAFVMDYEVHSTMDVACMFSSNNTVTIFNTTIYPSPPLYQSVYFFAPQYTLSSLINMLVDVAVLEFICSQSPYSMRGMMFGAFLSTKHLFQGLAIMSMVSFGIPWKASYTLSCGNGFYLMHTIIAVLILVLFSCVTRRYKYRNVNEPSNVYRYAEEYYSN